MDTEKLKALALAATPGKWQRRSGSVIVRSINGEWVADTRTHKREIDDDAPNAEFIAASCPATVLELCNERDALAADNERLRAEVREWLCIDCNTVYPGPPQPGIACVMCPKCSGTTMPRMRAEVERLKAELATRCRAEGGGTSDKSSELNCSAPAAGTDQDAERYRKIRAKVEQDYLSFRKMDGARLDAVVDNVLDPVAAIAAHTKEKSNG